MCGIFACIHCSHNDGIDPTLKAELVDKLRRRGPDHAGEATIAFGDDLQLDMIGTLLHMRGARPTSQPMRGNPNSSGTGGKMTEAKDNFLLWNGNIFGGELQISAEDNDTVKLFEALNQSSDPSGILMTMSKIHGPWAIVYWQSSTNSLWFGRDVFGRRSLLWHLPQSTSTDPFLLCSVGQYHPDKMPLGYWLEVPASCIFQLKCRADGSIGGDLLCYPWMQGDVSFQIETGIGEELSTLKTNLNIHKIDQHHLQVPFPSLNKSLPVHQSLPRHSSPALGRSEATKGERTESDVSSKEDATTTCASGSDSRVVCKVEARKVDERGASSLDKFVNTVDWSSLAKQLITVLEKAIHSRVVRAPFLPSSTSLLQSQGASSVSFESRKIERTSSQEVSGADKGDVNVTHGRARIAILFSGGVDSVLLAALVDRCLDPSEEIDLINVAFDQKSAQQTKQSESNFDVPDRISSIESLKELNPQRKWNLVLVNVTLDEVNTIRKERVSHLIFPLCTVLDDSIGCAFWFAARGQGSLYNSSEVCGGVSASTTYQSQARTLFVGVGADEQLAGYARHRTKFRAFGWAGLLDEVEMDIKRLARRNLGRDDRCIADHKREGQFPFLDEEVVAFLQQLPLHHKVDLDQPRGVGEKRLLREAAALLGCHGASKLPKRAIQFGSRMAKLSGTSNSKELGSDLCKRLLPN